MPRPKQERSNNFRTVGPDTRLLCFAARLRRLLGLQCRGVLDLLLAGSAERWIVGRIVFFRRNLGPLAAWSKALAKFWILRIVRVFRLLLRLAVMQVAE